MAKIRPGGLVGQISGSVGGDTFSRNRGGPYIRNRAIPTVSTTDFAMAAKNRLGLASTRWQTLSDAQRNAWTNWATNRPITDRLGESITLSGQQAYILINARLEQAGDTLLDIPPTAGAPDGLLEISLTAEAANGDSAATVTFSPSLEANHRLWVWSALVASKGVNYVKNLLRLTTISDPEAASPLDILSGVTERHGPLAVGQVLHVQAQVFDTETGLVSGVRRARVEVTEASP